MSFNSKEFAWANVQVVSHGRSIGGLRGVKYTVKKDKEAIYGRGENPHSIGSGNKEYEGELMLLQSEATLMQRLLADPTQDLTDLPPFDLVVSYVPKGAQAPVTDILKCVEITEDTRDMKQGDKFQEITLPMLFLGKQSV